MYATTRLHQGVSAKRIAALGIAAAAAAPLIPAAQGGALPAVAEPQVRLAAATGVPPGGLITSFLGNQLVNCSLICGPLIETGVTPIVTSLAAPGVFVTALQSGNVLQAFGAAAASVTGPTNAIGTIAVVKDGTLVAPKALNALETGVVGILDIGSAAATGGVPGILAAIQDARQNTFDALNAPLGTQGTADPHGVVEVAAVGALNVGGSIVFDGLNDIILGGLGAPNAAAQTLAATGDPVRAVAVGAAVAAGSVNAAVTGVTKAATKAIKDVGAAAGQPQSNMLAQNRTSATATTKLGAKPAQQTTALGPRHAKADAGGGNPVRNIASTVRQTTRNAVKNVTAGSGHQAKHRA
jgi:hypothetical protein